MAGAPKLKIYRNGEYVASCKYYEDAAAMVANGGSVKYDHKHVIWEDTPENAARAGDSYDLAAEIMREAVADLQQRAFDRVYRR